VPPAGPPNATYRHVWPRLIVEANEIV